MNYHPTPDHIVSVIKRHLPKKYFHILEPAAGEGALLYALGDSGFEDKQITLIDIDRDKVDILECLYPESSAIHADFLSWDPQGRNFDLIITNPPFSGRSENWVNSEGRSKPVEVCFIKKCMDLLSHSGTLIAIVPDSIVNSTKQQFIRELLLERNLKYCYQLPEKTFRNIEGKFFLLILKNEGSTRNLSLRRLSGDRIDNICVPKDVLASNRLRLDYEFYSTFNHNLPLSEIAVAYDSKAPIIDIVSAKRGRVRSNYKASHCVHTTNFIDGFWSCFHEETFNSRNPDDFFVICKRVSRDANYSWGLAPKSALDLFTDCIIVIEVESKMVFEALFLYRVMYANEVGKGAILRGAGAKFIAITDLLKTKVVDLSDSFKNEYIEFVNCYFSKDFEGCRSIECRVFSKLMYGDQVASLVTKNIEKDRLFGTKANFRMAEVV